MRQLIESADADAESMEAAEPAPEDAAAVVGPAGWHAPQIPAGATVLSESPIAYTLDNLLSDEEPERKTPAVRTGFRFNFNSPINLILIINLIYM